MTEMVDAGVRGGVVAGGAEEYAIHAARVVDPGEDLVLTDAHVRVRGGRVTRVVGGRPADVPVLDLGDATLLPGLIDCHTHMLLRPEDQVFPPAITFKPIPYRAIEGVAAARLALEAASPRFATPATSRRGTVILRFATRSRRASYPDRVCSSRPTRFPSPAATCASTIA